VIIIFGQLTINQRVTGSSPVSPIQKRGFSQQCDKLLVSALLSANKNEPVLKMIIEKWQKVPIELCKEIVRMVW